jgi:hypothetical protein
MGSDAGFSKELDPAKASPARCNRIRTSTCPFHDSQVQLKGMTSQKEAQTLLHNPPRRAAHEKAGL